MMGLTWAVGNSLWWYRFHPRFVISNLHADFTEITKALPWWVVVPSWVTM
jgi:hypothetical protein